MVPLYAARIGDLGPGDYVKAECIACGHVELLPPAQLRIKGQALPPYTPLLDLERGCAAASAMRAARPWCRSGGGGLAER